MKHQLSPGTRGQVVHLRLWDRGLEEKTHSPSAHRTHTLACSLRHPPAWTTINPMLGSQPCTEQTLVGLECPGSLVFPSLQVFQLLIPPSSLPPSPHLVRRRCVKQHFLAVHIPAPSRCFTKAAILPDHLLNDYNRC